MFSCVHRNSAQIVSVFSLVHGGVHGHKLYSKTCPKRQLKKIAKNWYSILIIA